MGKNIIIIITVLFCAWLGFKILTDKSKVINNTIHDTIVIKPNVKDSTIYNYFKVYDTISKTYIDTVIYRKTYTDTLVFTDFNLSFEADVVGDLRNVKFVPIYKPSFEIGGALGYKHLSVSFYYHKKKFRYGLGYDFINRSPVISVSYKLNGFRF